MAEGDRPDAETNTNILSTGKCNEENKIKW